MDATLQLLKAQAERVRTGLNDPVAAGDQARLDLLISDIGQRRRVEAQLAQAQAWMELAQEAGGVGTYEYVVATNDLTWSASVRALFGLPDDAPPTLQMWLARVHPEDRDATAEVARRAIEDGAPVRQLYRIVLPDGQLRWIEDRGRVIRSADGTVERVIGLNIDVTEMHETHEQKQLLMNELSHRVKNTMATVQAMFRQTLHGKVEPAAAEAFEGRLLAMSHAHDILTQQSWRSAEVADIVAQVLRPHSSGEERFKIRGAPAELLPQAALALAMALHELCTNASKYGSLSVKGGHVRLEWRLDRQVHPALVRLKWIEVGGPKVHAPKRPGFGSRMIRQAFGFDPHGEVTLDYAAAGLRCEIVMTAANREVAAPPLAPEAGSLAALDPIELDALSELMNIVTGKAAAGLASLLGREVMLTAPAVRALSRAEASAILSAHTSVLSAVQQAFEGEINGRALLILPQENTSGLVQLLIDGAVSDPQPAVDDALAEIGNVVLQAAIGTMANLLGRPLSVALPMLLNGSAHDVLGAPETGAVLFVQVDFGVRGHTVKGYILLLMHLRARSDLKDLAAEYISRALAGAERI